MADEYKFGGTVRENGTFELHDKAAVMRDLRALFKAGQRITFTVTEQAKGVRQEQRGFYFAGVVKTAVRGFEDAGEQFSADQARAILEHFSPYTKHIGEVLGETQEIQMPMSEVMKDRDRFTAHIDWCIRWIAENLGLAVEDPEQYLMRVYGRKKEPA